MFSHKAEDKRCFQSQVLKAVLQKGYWVKIERPLTELNGKNAVDLNQVRILINNFS